MFTSVARSVQSFEALAIDVLLSTDVAKAAALVGVTWDEAWHIMERAVVRGRGAKADAMPAKIGVDERAIAKGHRYMTVCAEVELSQLSLRSAPADLHTRVVTITFSAADNQIPGMLM